MQRSSWRGGRTDLGARSRNGDDEGRARAGGRIDAEVNTAGLTADGDPEVLGGSTQCGCEGGGGGVWYGAGARIKK